jgi:hypothetical protein
MSLGRGLMCRLVVVVRCNTCTPMRLDSLSVLVLLVEGGCLLACCVALKAINDLGDAGISSQWTLPRVPSADEL